MSQPPPVPLRLAIAGTGNVTRKNYVPFLAAQPGVELAYHNRTADKARALAREFGGTTVDSLAALMAWQPTAVLVLTAETCRDETGTALLHLGAKQLFFEKPLVAARGQARVGEDDFAAARKLLRLAAARGCGTAMVFNYRFLDQSIAAREVIASGRLGRVINITGQVHYACWSHAIDLILWLAGGIRELTALAGGEERTGDHVGAVPDLAASFLTDGGATGTLLGTAGIRWFHPLLELTFTLERGRVRLRDLGGPAEVLDATPAVHQTASSLDNDARWKPYDESFRRSLAAYLDSLRTGIPPPVPGVDGLRELQVEAAFRRSIAQRRPVILAEEFPLE
jgi:predicted dehydrogenase